MQPDQLPALLPCPFCGHQPRLDNLDDSCHPLNRERTLWTFTCLDNEGGCNAGVLAGSEQECYDKWNRRTDTERARADALQTSVSDWLYANGPDGWIEALRARADALEAALKELDAATDEQANLSDGEWPFKAKARVKAAKAAARALLEKPHD